MPIPANDNHVSFSYESREATFYWYFLDFLLEWACNGFPHVEEYKRRRAAFAG